MSEQEPERVVIRDNRKIDRKPGEAGTGGGSGPDVSGPEAGAARSVPSEPGEAAEAARLAQERTADLQRLQAEYANYRKRAERDRLAAGEVAVGRLLTELLPVLDDLDRARVHGDLTGSLKAVADHLDAVFAKVGLTAFGVVGDPFDPVIHEAVMHDESDAVDRPTATTVMRAGYRLGERVLRPAMVGVTDPVTVSAEALDPVESSADASATAEQDEAGAGE